jgi:hypothetical protein
MAQVVGHLFSKCESQEKKKSQETEVYVAKT